MNLLSDLTHQISRDYGVLVEDVGLALRGSFFIDTDGILRHISINDANVGRNMDEYLRLVEAFNYSKEEGKVTPAGWQRGKASMDPDHDSNQTKNYWKEKFQVRQ